MVNAQRTVMPLNPPLMVKPMTEVQLQHLYETDVDQRPRLYGGRMNEARRIEIKVVTQDAIEELHRFLIHFFSRKYFLYGLF